LLTGQRGAMPKKKPTRLPQIPGPSFRRPVPAAHHRHPSGARRQYFSQTASSFGDAEEDEYYYDGDSAEPSTTLPPGMSRDDVRSLSDLLDQSYQSAHGRESPFPPEDEDFQPQTVQAIIQDARKRVQDKNPHRREVDDALLEQWRLNDKQDRLERGVQVILPDNRIRVADQLSAGLRAQLLGEEEPTEPAPTAPRHPRRPDDGKPKKDYRRVRNPWYLHPTQWYTGADDDQGSDGEAGMVKFKSYEKEFQELVEAQARTEKRQPQSAQQLR